MLLNSLLAYIGKVSSLYLESYYESQHLKIIKLSHNSFKVNFLKCFKEIYFYPKNIVFWTLKKMFMKLLKMFPYTCSWVVAASSFVLFFLKSIIAPSITIMMPVVQNGRAKPPEILYNKLPTEGPAIPPTPKKKSSVPWINHEYKYINNLYKAHIYK